MMEILGVVIGWLLGVGTSWGQRWYDDRKRLREVKTSISIELDEVAHRLLGLVYKIEQRAGTLGRESLAWMLPHLERYDGPNPKEGMLAGVRGLLAQTDEQLAAMNAQTRGGPPAGFPRQGAPYTEATIGKLSELEPAYCAAVLDILSHLEMLNQRRDDQGEYTRRSFLPGISDENLQATYDDAERAQRDIHHRAKIVIRKISVLDAAHPRKRRASRHLLGGT